MGIKISDLSASYIPYSGKEQIPIVQNEETRVATLSSFINYLSGALLLDTELGALSGSWQTTFTTTQSNSANWSNAYSATRATSASWNSAYNTLCALSASWEESAEIIPTVTNYLSTNNILLSGLSVTETISAAKDIITSGDLFVGSGDSGAVSLHLGYNRSGAGNTNILMYSDDVGNVEGNITRGSGQNGTFTISNSGTGFLVFEQKSSAPITLETNDIERVRITGAGRVGIGTTAPNTNLTVSGDISATNVVYTRELDFGSLERPSLTGMKQALNSFLYVAPALSYVRVNGSSPLLTREVGSALATPAITWTSNKVEAAAVSNYLLTLPTGATSTGIYTFSAYDDPNTYNITTLPGTDTQATSAWSVRVTDWNGAQSTSDVSVSWRYRVYYGTTTEASPTDAQVRAGTEVNTLAISRTGLGSRTVTPNSEYIFVAYPVRFGTTAQFRVNGLPNTAFTLITINNFVNASGGTGDYYVYRSDNLLTGTYTIEII